ncbi:MAG: terminase small subunit, partial [Pseudomonadota bacterium]
MTPKQQAFCGEYQFDGNATQAAVRAGYSPRTAYSAGHRLLKNVEISHRIICEREAIWESQAMGISEAVAEM